MNKVLAAMAAVGLVLTSGAAQAQVTRDEVVPLRPLPPFVTVTAPGGAPVCSDTLNANLGSPAANHPYHKGCPIRLRAGEMVLVESQYPLIGISVDPSTVPVLVQSGNVEGYTLRGFLGCPCSVTYPKGWRVSK
jgi:hypothetical protein